MGSFNESYAQMSPDYNHSFVLTFLRTTYEVPFAQEPGSWTLSLRPLRDGPVLLSSLDPRFPFDRSDDILEPPPKILDTSRVENYKQGDSIPLLTGSSYLVFNVTNGDSSDMPAFRDVAKVVNENPAYLFTTYEEGFSNLNVVPRDEWLIFTIPELPGWEASVSLCYDSLTTVDLPATLTINKAPTEPSLTVFDDSAKRFSTDEIRLQLDYREDQGERNIMSLESTPDELKSQMLKLYQAALSNNSTTIHNQSFIASLIRRSLSSENLYILCEDCTYSNTSPTFGDNEGEYISGATQQIFMNIAQQSQDLSLAFSGYFTILARMMYYDALPYFNIPNQSAISQFEMALFPKRFTDLVIVLSVLSVHVVIIIAIIIVFLRQTRMSRIEDAAWQAIGQVVCEETQDLLKGAMMMPDSVVEKRIVETGIKDIIVVLKVLDDPQERVGLTEKRKQL